MSLFHLLETPLDRPAQLNNPFDYQPDALSLLAAEGVRRHLATLPEWAAEVAQGKMFGVLVCENARGQLGFLAAYSGQVLGRADWPWFVPAVFDYLQPEGYFRQEEARITALNQQVARLERSADMQALLLAQREQEAQARAEVAALQEQMRTAKQRRDALRGTGIDDELTRESQFQKAELRRLRRRWDERLADVAARLAPLQQAVASLKHERKHRSDALQRWLFDQFVMLNAQGEGRTLTSIFAPTAQRVPPSGAGECCAPKLLQYAFSHQLRPLRIAEFWQGRSPRMEIRHHDQFYTACRGKCKPILEWMLGAAFTAGAPAARRWHVPVVYADDALLVVNKPSGLLSVPGKGEAPSVESLLRRQYGEVYMVHRLDMDTSGLLVVARTTDAYHHLQRQFLQRTVQKQYVALLDGVVEGEGTIALPMRPDPLDRPRQVVDFDHGKPAVTHYRVLKTHNGQTLVALTPHTGRTHQLRIHCAHAEGLATPIVGDGLYGRPARRLCLHACKLAFAHPSTGQQLQFSAPAEDFFESGTKA